MVENGIWEVVKVVVQFVAAPVIGFLVWMHKKQDGRIEHLEERIADAEKQLAVIDTKLDHIYNSIQRIERGVVKLTDKQQ